MSAEVNSINLSLPFKLGSVNCYLIKTHKGYILIDTGGSNRRADLEKELFGAGCQPGHLTLIVITHGDFDHIGNAAYLRQKFGAKIVMHADDVGMAERGDMFWNRKKGNRIFRSLAPKLLRFGAADRFQPDVIVADGTNLTEYGFDAKVLSMPGHSKGSIGILTSAGDLFCGDLLENTKQPAISSIMDDTPTAQASIEKLESCEVKTVYPGHGKPFPLKLFLEKR
jgi:glyoxylase-like metal-dependent hydrolase (beta-lactamase superfamily II)